MLCYAQDDATSEGIRVSRISIIELLVGKRLREIMSARRENLLTSCFLVCSRTLITREFHRTVVTQ
jgi:hypothetical protein